MQREFMGAVSLLKTENDFVLDKLALFIDRAKKEANFNDWKLPVPKQNFQRLLSLTKDMANSLLDQWLRKQYLTDTGERDEYRVVIYSINPYLEEALKNLQKLKIPQPWLGGFMQITADGLENKGYFDLINRTELLGDKFRLIFQRDINELFFNYLMGHQKTTIVLAGSLVELALIFYCDKAGVATIAVTEGSKTKNKPLYSCVLIELITYVEQIKAFGKDFGHLTNLSRIYRNYVHPGKELGDAIDRTKADLCFMSTVEILKRTI
ncbi:hypothetical protein ACRQ5D_33845 [Mucilaginibacter sp. P25]|uniref:hypothetical protein n=1 Tax=Mucilaginibacter sp. P25 TaxID=3423945 RepID=UPI003D7B0FF1